MACGNGKQTIFYIEDDYRRMVEGLEKTVGRTGWEVFAYVWTPNHIRLFLRTPKPNLSKGMQYLFSGYANWYAKHHQRIGHLFQGRFRDAKEASCQSAVGRITAFLIGGGEAPPLQIQETTAKLALSYLSLRSTDLYRDSRRCRTTSRFQAAVEKSKCLLCGWAYFSDAR